MGVPRLFPFTTQTFPKAVKHFQHGEHHTPVDYLLIDANGLLHAACQEVYHYGSNTSVIDRYEGLSDKAKLRKVCEMFFEYIRQIVTMITPAKVLFIALDGPAPLAKQSQQRQRRFIAARSRADAAFDSNSITPGTLFMHEVTKFMNHAIRREINGRFTWRSFKVRFSPCTVPGEGEHKLMDYVRGLSTSERTSRFCMFGPDGDLIMLTLATHVSNMLLFREDQYQFGFFHLLDMGLIRRQLLSLFPPVHGRGLDDAINDFVFLGFFVGNDFLPKVQMFYYLEEGLEMMMRTYTPLIRAGSFVTANGKVHLPGIKAFIAAVAQFEVEYVQKQASVTPAEPMFRNETLLRNVKGGVLDMKGYRKEYYAKANAHDEETIGRMCRDYFRTLVWIFEYYIHGLPAWRWIYPWHYAPLLTDLARVLDDLTDVEVQDLITFSLEEPSPPFVQLLSVLPLTSSVLLPPPYRSLMQSGPLAEIYPSTFIVDYEGKIKEHMGVALLPFVDYNVVYRAYRSVRSKVANDPYHRNKFGTDSVFSYDENYTAKYTSDYGTISNMKVRKE